MKLDMKKSNVKRVYTKHVLTTAKELLDQLKTLDEEVSCAFYEMGRLLSAIESARLWEVLGYTSFSHIIEEELSFGHTTAWKYLHAYRDCKFLGYNKTESLDMIQKFSFTRVAQYVATAQTKVSKRAVAIAINKNREQTRQLNFYIKTSDYDKVVATLKKFGCTETDTGRLQGSSEAFVELVKDVA